MSFQRHEEIYRPMMPKQFEAGREAASRWSVPSPAIGRGGNEHGPAHRPMSLRLAIPGRMLSSSACFRFTNRLYSVMQDHAVPAIFSERRPVG
jgi:hypothetical protein